MSIYRNLSSNESHVDAASCQIALHRIANKKFLEMAPFEMDRCFTVIVQSWTVGAKSGTNYTSLLGWNNS